MMSGLIAIGIVIVLFVIYGLVRPSPGCTGHCSGCSGDHSCETYPEEKHV